MTRTRNVLTTGEVARICSVAPRTVSKWFDSGQLRGYRIPGSKDRRIPLDQLIRFMRANGMPVDGLDVGRTCVLIVEEDGRFADSLAAALADQSDYETYVASSCIEAGALANEYRPQAIIFNVKVSDFVPAAVVRWVHSVAELADTCLIATGKLDAAAGETLIQAGFDAWLSVPFGVHEITELVESFRLHDA